MNKFKHSGALGDLVYSLPLVKYLGGGEFYLHLDQINWIGQHYYGSMPDPFHQGRMNLTDFEFMRSFMLAQPYITEFGILDHSTEITHNLDRFRVPFVGHPGNYVDIYSSVLKITDVNIVNDIRNQPWLNVPNPKQSNGRTVVVNRTRRWIPASPGDQWQQWRDEGAEEVAVFVGLPDEYESFKKEIGWDIPYQETKNMLDLAEYIAGCDQFIGNQSMALSMAIGLGVSVCCEARQDLPIERNECYFPNLERVSYF